MISEQEEFSRMMPNRILKGKSFLNWASQKLLEFLSRKRKTIAKDDWQLRIKMWKIFQMRSNYLSMVGLKC